MAFENINTVNLRNSLVACKEAINTQTIIELKNKISNDDVWKSKSRDTLKRSLEKLETVRYKELEDKLNNYIDLVQYIEEYQNLQMTINEDQSKYNSLSSNLTEEKNKEKKDSSKMYEIQSKMDDMSTRIGSSRSRMAEIETYVSNSI